MTDTTKTIPELERALGSAVQQFEAVSTIKGMLRCIDSMWALLYAKGYKHGYANDVAYRQDHGPAINVHLMVCDTDYNNAHTIKHTGSAADIGATMRAAATEVLNLPTHDDWRRAQFQAKLRAMVTEAELLNIGVEYSRMLMATADKMATNVLAAPRVFVVGDDDDASIVTLRTPLT